MADRNGAPEIAPGNIQVPGAGGAEAQVVADVDPAQFPIGLELVVYRPGELQPIGRGHIPAGCMLLALPPELAKHLRPAVRQSKRLDPGQVDAPGTKG